MRWRESYSVIVSVNKICSILTFMEYNPNVILLIACSHYVIKYLHKFSCPSENGFWPGSPESKQGVPLWVLTHAPYTVPACRAHHPAHAASALASSCDSAWWSAYNACMADYMVEMGHENGVRDGGDSFFETLWFDSARILYSVFVNRRFEIHPVLIHAALTSRIISVPDCKLQSGEYSHEIKYNNGISGLVYESGLPAYCVTRLRSLLFSIVPFTAFSMDSRNG